MTQPTQNFPDPSFTGTVMTLQDAARYHLLPGTLDRARNVLAESEALVQGAFLADPSAPMMFGRLQAMVAELLRTFEAVTA